MQFAKSFKLNYILLIFLAVASSILSNSLEFLTRYPALLSLLFVPILISFFALLMSFGNSVFDLLKINSLIFELNFLRKYIFLLTGLAFFSFLCVALGFFQAITYKSTFLILFFICTFGKKIEFQEVKQLPPQGLVIIFLGFLLTSLRGVLPIGADNWGDLHRYYGFFTLFFAHNNSFSSFVELLPSYFVFPMQVGFINGSLTAFFSEKFTASFNSSLTIITAITIFYFCFHYSKGQLFSFACALTMFFLINPYNFDNSPLHFRSHEIFWIWAAAIFSSYYLIEKVAAASVATFLGFSMAIASMYGSLLHVFGIIIFFLVSLKNQVFKKRVHLLAVLSLFGLSSVWYFYSWLNSGSPIAFTNFKIDLINPSYLSNDFMWRIASRELANQMDHILLHDFFKILFSVCSEIIPMAFLILIVPYVILKRANEKRIALSSALQLCFFLLYLFFAFYFVLKTGTNALGNKRHFYAALPFLGMSSLLASIVLYRFLNSFFRKIFTALLFLILLIPSPETNYIKTRLPFLFSYWIGSTNSEQYLFQEYPDLALASNLINLNVPPEEAVLSHWGDLFYTSKRKVFALPMSKVGGDFWNLSNDQVEAEFKKRNIKWFLLNTNWFAQPYTDQQHATLVDLLNPSLNSNILHRLKKIASASHKWSSIILFKIEEQPQKEDSVLRTYLLAQEMLSSSNYNNIKSYRKDFHIKNPSPFFNRYSIPTEIKEGPNNSLLINATSCPAEYIYLPLQFTSDYDFNRPADILVIKEGAVIHRQKYEEPGQVISFKLKEPLSQFEIQIAQSGPKIQTDGSEIRAFNVSNNCRRP